MNVTIPGNVTAQVSLPKRGLQEVRGCHLRPASAVGHPERCHVAPVAAELHPDHVDRLPRAETGCALGKLIFQPPPSTARLAM